MTFIWRNHGNCPHSPPPTPSTFKNIEIITSSWIIKGKTILFSCGGFLSVLRSGSPPQRSEWLFPPQYAHLRFFLIYINWIFSNSYFKLKNCRSELLAVPNQFWVQLHFACFVLHSTITKSLPAYYQFTINGVMGTKATIGKIVDLWANSWAVYLVFLSCSCTKVTLGKQKKKKKSNENSVTGDRAHTWPPFLIHFPL